MGFFDWIFGKGKKGEPRLEKLALKDFRDWLEKRSKKERELLKELAAGSFSEIRHLLKEIDSSLKDFEARDLEEEDGSKHLRKIVETSKQGFVQHTRNLLSKLEPPRSEELAAISSYALSAQAVLDKEILAFRKDIAYTSVLMKKEIKSIGEQIESLQGVLKKLKEAFEENPAFFSLTAPLQLHDAIWDLVFEKQKLEKELSVLEEEKKFVAEKRKGFEAELAELQKSPLVKELEALKAKKSELLGQKQALKTELSDKLSTIDKPLNRFQQLVESKRFALEQKEAAFLKSFLQNPLLAFKSDPSGKSFKKILQEMRSAIETDALQLKDREKEKRSAAIDELLAFNVFDNVFWRFNQLDAELQRLDREISGLDIAKRSDSLERSIADLQKETERKGTETTALSKKMDGVEKSLQEKRQELEEVVQKSLGAKIEIAL